MTEETIIILLGLLEKVSVSPMQDNAADTMSKLITAKNELTQALENIQKPN